MNTLAIAAAGSAWLGGFLFVLVCWPRDGWLRRDLPVLLPLAWLLGLGMTSVTYFAATLCVSSPLILAEAANLIVMIALAGLVHRKWRTPAPAGGAPLPAMAWGEFVLATVFIQFAVVALVIAARAYGQEPYGDGDGWTIWNLHARVLFRGGTHWPEVAARPELVWTHPDYPGLVPASVARVWSWMRTEAPFGSGIVSTGFGIATVAMLVAIVCRLQGRLAAIAGGILLLGTPFFVTFSPDAHADIPLGSYVLAAVALVLLAGPFRHPGIPWLAGITAGFAGWTKNEGLLFAFVFAAAWGLMSWRRGDWRSFRHGMLGLAVGLLPVCAFKLLLAPPNDLVSAPVGPRLAHAFDASRHRMIIAAFRRDLGGFGQWSVRPYAIMALPFLALLWRRWRAAGTFPLIVLLLMLAGYYGVYVLTPHDLGWHLDSSLVRLLTQLWPLALFAWALALPPAEVRREPAVVTSPAPRSFPWLVFTAVNVACAAAIVDLGARQLAPGELVRQTVDGAKFTVALGDGWHAIEANWRDRWAWSPGESTLLLHADRSVTAKLCLVLHGITAQNVTVRLDDRVLWRGMVDQRRQLIRIGPLGLSSGIARLAFTSDTPGRPESTAPGARRLSFAIHDVALEPSP